MGPFAFGALIRMFLNCSVAQKGRLILTVSDMTQFVKCLEIFGTRTKSHKCKVLQLLFR